MSTLLDKKHSSVTGIQVSSNEKTHSYPRGDNKELAKTKKTFISRTNWKKKK